MRIISSSDGDTYKGLCTDGGSDGADLIPPTQFHSKMENAEVLEMTVKKVEEILKSRTQGLPTFKLANGAGNPYKITI